LLFNSSAKMRHLVLIVATVIASTQVSPCKVPILSDTNQAVLTDKQIQQLQKHTKVCRAETGVSLELIAKARNGDFADDLKLKEHFLCVGKRFGLATESGQIDLHVLRSRVRKATASEEETDNIVSKCVVKKDTPRETFFELSKCIHVNLPDFAPGD
jgi:hypothetical protein